MLAWTSSHDRMFLRRHVIASIKRKNVARELTHIRASRAEEPGALIGCAGVVTGS